MSRQMTDFLRPRLAVVDCRRSGGRKVWRGDGRIKRNLATLATARFIDRRRMEVKGATGSSQGPNLPADGLGDCLLSLYLYVTLPV